MQQQTCQRVRRDIQLETWKQQARQQTACNTYGRGWLRGWIACRDGQHSQRLSCHDSDSFACYATEFRTLTAYNTALLAGGLRILTYVDIVAFIRRALLFPSGRYLDVRIFALFEIAFCVNEPSSAACC